MHNRDNLPIPDHLLDRLVDGQLSDEEYRLVLRALENSDEGWRQCALAFLENQALQREFQWLEAAEEEVGCPDARPAPLGGAPLGGAPLGGAPLGGAPLGGAPLGAGALARSRAIGSMLTTAALLLAVFAVIGIQYAVGVDRAEIGLDSAVSGQRLPISQVQFRPSSRLSVDVPVAQSPKEVRAHSREQIRDRLEIPADFAISKPEARRCNSVDGVHKYQATYQTICIRPAEFDDFQ